MIPCWKALDRRHRNPFSYSIDLGPPPKSLSHLRWIRSSGGEFVSTGLVMRPAVMPVQRRGAIVRSRGAGGSWQNVHERLSGFDSMLSQLDDPRTTPELLALRGSGPSRTEHVGGTASGEAHARRTQDAGSLPLVAFRAVNSLASSNPAIDQHVVYADAASRFAFAMGYLSPRT
jgi:predicted ATPase